MIKRIKCPICDKNLMLIVLTFDTDRMQIRMGLKCTSCFFDELVMVSKREEEEDPDLSYFG